jgi:hypothetical protein
MGLTMSNFKEVESYIIKWLVINRKRQKINRDLARIMIMLAKAIDDDRWVQISVAEQKEILAYIHEQEKHA